MLRLALLLIAYLLLLMGIAGLAGHFLPGTDLVLIGWASFSPYLMLGGPVSLVLFALARLTGPAIVAAGLTVVVVALQAPLFIASSPGSGTPVTALTVNMKRGRADAASIVDLVNARHVQVLMLEELTTDARERLRAAGLDDVLPHSISDPRRGGAGTGLWSRYELTDATRETGFFFAMVTAHVLIPGVSRPPLVIALHMAGPFPDNATAWRADTARIRSFLFARPGRGQVPVVVGGDFNATWNNREFRAMLRQGYRDSGEQSGSRFLASYPAGRPLIGIDHVLLRDAGAVSARTVSIPASDHRGLLVQLRLHGF